MSALAAIDAVIDAHDYERKLGGLVYTDREQLAEARSAFAQLQAAARMSVELGRVTGGLSEALARVQGAG